MKTILAAAVLGTALFSGAQAIAAEKDAPPSQTGQFDEKRMKMHNDQMEKHMKDMQALMDKLHVTKDPAERRRLLDQHRKEMNELMREMRGSREDMVMGMMGGGPRHGGPMPEGEKLRQHLIEKRLDMMDNAMEMMMRRDEMMHP